ncbi:phosphoenolpyruvate--protein phosphotransferase [Sphingosinicella sp. LHD-64]|uniref:phosphoenolpyruvate--protein phosphotransferase n=1 Tax=Sphingosinicella sp. LHD-64 TaxID=3072139 RepID=UPI00280ED43B|nr:phosphoenolpyruvate--protein phosphotransferase [Sphingosinicella sp. LHD-64]MDQ8756928.1 phosphoenolpyruvate--protein phosphotransferase [Sphingosinicella sp. LHD-64]
MTAIILHAPFAGWAAPLDEVPDAVFAERMMGDGLAIDPLEAVLRAPCDAEVISVPATAHAVTLRLANGAELLIHIGLETVALGGAGFTAHVAAGQQVRRGDPLIDFDLDLVAEQAKSLITPIVLTSEGYRLAALAVDRAVAAGDPIAEVSGGQAPTAVAPAEQEAHRTDISIGVPNGIHARPAARIAAAAKGFASALDIEARGKAADARSPVALMTLGLVQGDTASLVARGPDAEAALVALKRLIETGLGDEHDATPRPVPSGAPTAKGALRGVCAAPGLAVGPAAQFAAADIRVEARSRGTEAERHALAAARAKVATELAGQGGSIALAHEGLLDDPKLLALADAGIAAGQSAGIAWQGAILETAEALRATGQALLIERIDDLHDLERQVLAALAGEAGRVSRAFPDGAILIADLLFPSDMMALDLTTLGGICTARGGPTSHVAILAASASVPMLVAVGDRIADIPEGRAVILDASAGWVDPAPDDAALAAASQRVDDRRRIRAAEAAAATEDCRMADGTRIEIFANLASPAEAQRAVAAGAEGCGLLRTEFLFHDRADAPSEDEQAAVYEDVARGLGGRPLIVRTLDAGGDKPLPYLRVPQEENPALGLRGVRLSLARPDLLATQLRAILRATGAGDIRIMVPMIVDVAELRFVRALLDEAADALGLGATPLGVMVETPAAALLAGSLAAEADFLSIGTNDLTQYALAADRGNPATASRIDALHPAVLRLIAATGEGGRRHGKWFGICGGVASDPLAAAILIGLGATELSATPAAIAALKAAVRRLTMADCRALAVRALEAETAEAVRILAAEAQTPAFEGATA